MHVFDSFVRRLVEEGAAAIGVPPDLIAVPLLGFAAATIGNTAKLTLKEGWSEHPILYLAVVAPPGTAKTPALNLARGPLDLLQAEAVQRYATELAQYKSELAAWQGAEKETRCPEPERPRLRPFFTTDATIEALAALLSQAPPGIALCRDELVSWVRSCDAYRGGRGGDRQAWLSLWSGTPLKVDRKTREPVYVAHPVVCVVVVVQPDMLPELHDDANRRDGFVDRIAWAYPEPRSSGWTEATVSPETTEAVAAVFSMLRQPDETRGFRLAPDAKAAWVAWFDQNREQIDTASGLLQGAYAKLPVLAARLALVLHLLAHPANPPALVGANTLQDALDLVEYFRGHAQRALMHLAGATAGDMPSRVLRQLQRSAWAWVSRAELHRGLGGHVAAEQLTAALRLLAERHVAERRSVPSGERGRPAEQWRATLARTSE